MADSGTAGSASGTAAISHCSTGAAEEVPVAAKILAAATAETTATTAVAGTNPTEAVGVSALFEALDAIEERKDSSSSAVAFSECDNINSNKSNNGETKRKRKASDDNSSDVGGNSNKKVSSPDEKSGNSSADKNSPTKATKTFKSKAATAKTTAAATTTNAAGALSPFEVPEAIARPRRRIQTDRTLSEHLRKQLESLWKQEDAHHQRYQQRLARERARTARLEQELKETRKELKQLKKQQQQRTPSNTVPGFFDNNEDEVEYDGPLIVGGAIPELSKAVQIAFSGKGGTSSSYYENNNWIDTSGVGCVDKDRIRKIFGPRRGMVVMYAEDDVPPSLCDSRSESWKDGPLLKKTFKIKHNNSYRKTPRIFPQCLLLLAGGANDHNNNDNNNNNGGGGGGGGEGGDNADNNSSRNRNNSIALRDMLIVVNWWLNLSKNAQDRYWDVYRVVFYAPRKSGDCLTLRPALTPSLRRRNETNRRAVATTITNSSSSSNNNNNSCSQEQQPLQENRAGIPPPLEPSLVPPTTKKISATSSGNGGHPSGGVDPNASRSGDSSENNNGGADSMNGSNGCDSKSNNNTLLAESSSKCFADEVNRIPII